MPISINITKIPKYKIDKTHMGHLTQHIPILRESHTTQHNNLFFVFEWVKIKDKFVDEVNEIIINTQTK